MTHLTCGCVMALKKTEERVKLNELKPYPRPGPIGPVSRLFAHIGAWYIRNLDHEKEHAEPFIWFSFFTMLGVIVYFVAPQEPVLAVSSFTALSLGALTWWMRARTNWFFIFLGFFGLSLGFTSANIKTAFMSPTLLENTITGSFTGLVHAVEPRKGGSIRVIFSEVTSQTLREREKTMKIPERIQVSMRSKHIQLEPGHRYTFRARLTPLSGPVVPGGFDFGRALFFKGIGATGFVFGAPELIEERNWSGFENLRQSISDRITSAFQSIDRPDLGAIAISLLVGQRGAISDEHRESLSVSGLAHILAISGLHMALVVVFVIGLIRRLLSLAPEIALKYPIRHYAVAIGVATGLAYFLISGASISATRAFIMILIMAFAWLLGRRALSLRNVALAAFLILLLEPQAVNGPGFQMSFIATLALVAFSKFWLFPERKLSGQQLPATTQRVVTTWHFFRGIAITSIVAGLATALFAAFHFYKIAPLGLITNLLGMPIFSLIVMPFGLFSLFLMPFGYEMYPLHIMALGLDAILYISDQTASYSRMVSHTGALSQPIFVTMALIMVIGLLLKSQFKYVALLVCVSLCFSLPAAQHPTVFIASDGKTIAVYEPKTSLSVVGERSGRFDLKVWKEYLELPPDMSHSKGLCDETGCILRYHDITIAQVKQKRAFAEDCYRADIIVTVLKPPPYCKPSLALIDRNTLLSRGAHKITLTANSQKITTETAIPALKRPWHAHRHGHPQYQY